MKRIILRPKNWWKKLSVAHKLYAVVGIMAFLIASELFTLLFAMNTLSAVRALVGGEGIWSKAQKDAVLELQGYARTGEEQRYNAFLKHIQIPLGDHLARIEMQKTEMNMGAVRDGFLMGHIHKDDITPVVELLRRFYKISYIANAIQIWRQGDELMFRLIAVADDLHHRISIAHSKSDREDIRERLAQISEINDQLTDVENRFSYTLGEASRWLEHLLMIVLIIAVATVESTGLVLTVIFSRSLKRTLSELHGFALNVGAGDLSKSLPVRSGDELGQLANALNKMVSDLKEITGERQIAEKANRIKNLFLANMSHEIRTPLNSILGFVDLLKDPGLSRNDRQKYLEIIERTGFSLASIINDILDISKVEAGKLEFEKSVCSLPQLLTDLKSMLNFRCEEKGIYLHFRKEELPDEIVTDATRYKQILLNIIGNAIKFTEAGGVTVTFSIRSELLVCTVVDTGVGVARESVEKLFQPFSQVDLSIQKKFGGTGLGLILSRRLANLLGGDVVLHRSGLGQGSTFIISIAYKDMKITSPDQKVKKLNTAKKYRSLRGRKILVVEDMVDNQLLARQYLIKEGISVDIANHGLEAIEYIKRGDYDLVLMDMQMPIMDGYTATEQLRSMGCEVPIIALTAHAMKEDLKKCLNVGCNSYLSKPFRRDALIHLVRQLCDRAA